MIKIYEIKNIKLYLKIIQFLEERKKQVNVKYLDFNKNDKNNLFGNMIIKN